MKLVFNPDDHTYFDGDRLHISLDANRYGPGYIMHFDLRGKALLDDDQEFSLVLRRDQPIMMDWITSVFTAIRKSTAE